MDKPNAYDVAVIGGSLAGLSAALVLGRSLRRTLVLDTGEPRNAPSSGVHGFFTRDGAPPAELLRIGREQLASYPSVEVRVGRAVDARGEDGGFEVSLEDGSSARARKLLLATGVVDELPEVPGFRELWGRGVFHCPYCHGWEVRDQPLALYTRGEGVLERVTILRNWSRDLMLCSDGPLGLDEAGHERLDVLGVEVREDRISRLDGANGRLRRILFEDGPELLREGFFYMPPQRQRSGLAESLGCKMSEAGPALVVENDPLTRETSVPGVYVAGDAGSPVQSAIMAAASGANAAYFINHAIVAENTEEEVRASGGLRSS